MVLILSEMRDAPAGPGAWLKVSDMQQAANEQAALSGGQYLINPDLLACVLARFSNAELDVLDAELSEYSATGKASERITKMLDVLDAQKQRRQSNDG